MKVELRFLQPGLIKADAPEDFDSFSDKEKEEWGNKVLQDLKTNSGDFALIEAMSNLAGFLSTGEFFDVAPTVDAIQAKHGEETLFQTEEWRAYVG